MTRDVLREAAKRAMLVLEDIVADHEGKHPEALKAAEDLYSALMRDAVSQLPDINDELAQALKDLPERAYFNSGAMANVSTRVTLVPVAQRLKGKL